MSKFLTVSYKEYVWATVKVDGIPKEIKIMIRANTLYGRLLVGKKKGDAVFFDDVEYYVYSAFGPNNSIEMRYGIDLGKKFIIREVLPPSLPKK